ncbi:MAG: HEAT repeat [Candidatus Methanocomedens sp.]|nr:MAG: HEAT repeat [ANME-2 cluster archaeon]
MLVNDKHIHRYRDQIMEIRENTASKKWNINILLEHLVSGSSDDPDAEWKAAIVLGEVHLPEEKQQAVMGLIEALSSKRAHALTRAHAAEALGRLEGTRAVQDLIDALKDDYQLVRAYAARSLGKLRNEAAIEPLVHTLSNDPFFGARAEAAEALRNLCQKDKTLLCQTARQALQNYREEELKRHDERSRRVLAEIDQALDILK